MPHRGGEMVSVSTILSPNCRSAQDRFLPSLASTFYAQKCMLELHAGTFFGYVYCEISLTQNHPSLTLGLAVVFGLGLGHCFCLLGEWSLRRTFYDLYCLFFSQPMMLNLSQSVIFACIYQIVCISGHTVSHLSWMTLGQLRVV